MSGIALFFVFALGALFAVEAATQDNVHDTAAYFLLSVIFLSGGAAVVLFE